MSPFGNHFSRLYIFAKKKEKKKDFKCLPINLGQSVSSSPCQLSEEGGKLLDVLMITCWLHSLQV